ncbi:MAG TPA: hypothetical protein GX513_07890 [Firmicutes bacterium]|nr:hypothetical protein [Bacillota bacterium]
MFEWLDEPGTRHFLAVFTHDPGSPMGPLSPLPVGGLDLARPNGRVVCRGLGPDAETYLRKSGGGPLVLETRQDHVNVREAARQLRGPGQGVSSTPGWQLCRGTYTASGVPAPEVVAGRADRTEVFRWEWDGRWCRREVGGETVRARAVVIVFADETSGPLGSRDFPHGVFAGDGGRALLHAGGHEIPAAWTRRTRGSASLRRGPRLALAGAVTLRSHLGARGGSRC